MLNKKIESIKSEPYLDVQATKAKPSLKARATMIMKDIEHTNESLSGYDRFGYLIDIQRERKDKAYISVLMPNGQVLYDGYYTERAENMRDLVIEAIYGAALVCPRC